MTYRYFAIALLMLSSGSVIAQERSAVGGTKETQASWSALNERVNGFKGRLTDMTTRVQKVETCNNKGMLYAPGVGGDDCWDSSSETNTTPNLTELNYKIDSIIGCGVGQKFFTGTGCVAPYIAPPPVYRWVAAGTGTYNLNNCPASVGNICSPQGAICKTTTSTSVRCMGNQCGGMGSQIVYTYNKFVCN